MKRKTLAMAAPACAWVLLLAEWGSAAEIIGLNAGIGVTTTATPSMTWLDQASGTSSGGAQNFTGSFSATPTLVTNSTPTGTSSISFNGATTNPNMLSTGSTPALTASALTFMLVLKPGTLTGSVDTYLNSTISGASGSENGFGLYRDGTNFFANVRGTTASNSTISGSAVGSSQTDWMILSGVYTPSGTNGIVQLFLTNAAGTLFTGSATTITGGMTSGNNTGTQLGARGAGRAEAAAMNLAAVSIWNESMDDTTRLATEKTLYQTFIGRSVLGAVSVTTPAAIITGGSAAFTYTVANSGTGYGGLSFTGTGLSGIVGTSSGTAATQTTSSSVSGLTFTGTSVGSGQIGTFTVSDPNAFGATSTTGTVSVDVYGHASGSATGATIALADSIVGYTGSLLGLTSATISNAAGYRVNLMTTGGTSAGFVNINNVSGIAAGSTGLISAAAILTGSQSVGSNSLGQSFSLTYADNSALLGASNNLGSQSIVVTGNVLDHATPGFLASGITNAYTDDVLNINFGSIDETAGLQSFTYNLLNLASQTYGAGLTAGLDFTGVTADGNGFASGLTTFNNLLGGGTSSLFTLTFNPTGQGTFNKSFTLSFSDNQNLAGAAARRNLTINAQVVVVPEPGTIALAALGTAVAGWSIRRRRRSTAA